MSYLDRTQDPRRRRIAIAGVVIIHAAIGFVLVTGLVETFVPPAPPPRLVGGQIPLPPPPPDPTPTPTAAATSTNPVAPTPPVPLPTNTGATVDPFDPTKEQVGPVIPLPPYDPTPTATPGPALSPRGAAPRNDPASWVRDEDYPSRAIREELEGTTRFRLVIGSNGRVNACEVTRSSGHPLLDEATCRFVSGRARFDPATDGNGRKVVGSYASSVRWVPPRR